jgi:hypothetical protein
LNILILNHLTRRLLALHLRGPATRKIRYAGDVITPASVMELSQAQIGCELKGTAGAATATTPHPS